MYGYLVSEVVCMKEAEKRGREHPRYGSCRFIITKAQFGGTIYNVDRFANVGCAGKLLNLDLDEERLILETSLVLEQGVVKAAHAHLSGLTEGEMYSLPMVEPPYIRKGHTTDLMRKDGRNILTYFIKAWADYVQNPELVTEEEKQFLDTNESISPGDLVISLLNHLTLPELVLR